MLRGFHLFMCIALTGDCRPTGNERCTVHHPFWVASGRELTDRPRPANLLENESEGLSLEGRWEDSHDVRAGDVLVSRDGSRRRVLASRQEYVEGFEVRNLTVQEFPSYAVGRDFILAHNEGSCDKIRDVIESITAKHGKLECKARAEELSEAIDKAGVEHIILKLEFKAPGDNSQARFDFKTEEIISENGIHYSSG